MAVYELHLLDGPKTTTAIVAKDHADAEVQARSLMAGWYRGQWKVREATSTEAHLERRNAQRRPERPAPPPAKRTRAEIAEAAAIRSPNRKPRHRGR